MIRLLPFLTLICAFCQNTSGEIKAIEDVISYNNSGEVISQRRKITQYSEFSWSSTTLDSKGAETDSWQSFQQGNISSLYHKGELQSIRTKNLETGCSTDRDFSKHGFGEFTSCNGEEVHNVFFSKDQVLEKKCTNSTNKQVCHATENGRLAFIQYRLMTGNTIIDYDVILNDEVRYELYISYDLPVGIRTDCYHMILTAFEAVPAPNDSRWKWSYTETKTGYINSIQQYSLVKFTDPDGSQDSRLEIF